MVNTTQTRIKLQIANLFDLTKEVEVKGIGESLLGVALKLKEEMEKYPPQGCDGPCACTGACLPPEGLMYRELYHELVDILFLFKEDYYSRLEG